MEKGMNRGERQRLRYFLMRLIVENDVFQTGCGLVRGSQVNLEPGLLNR